MSAFYQERVIDVVHWTDTLFSFTATRDPGFRFHSGQFTMLGLELDGCPLLRAYSMASDNHEESLEFFSIKVPDGPLTSRLQHIQPGDAVLVGRKATGTLVADNLLPGARLLLLSTGTGLAPFASIVKDPDIYERYGTIVLVHGCRQIAELNYGERLVERLRQHEFFGPLPTSYFAIAACRRSTSPPIGSCCVAAQPCLPTCARSSKCEALSKVIATHLGISSSNALSSSDKPAAAQK
jgi:ferredoxin--NADP+ reductase